MPITPGTSSTSQGFEAAMASEAGSEGGKRSLEPSVEEFFRAGDVWRKLAEGQPKSKDSLRFFLEFLWIFWIRVREPELVVWIGGLGGLKPCFFEREWEIPP